MKGTINSKFEIERFIGLFIDNKGSNIIQIVIYFSKNLITILDEENLIVPIANKQRSSFKITSHIFEDYVYATLRKNEMKKKLKVEMNHARAWFKVNLILWPNAEIALNMGLTFNGCPGCIIILGSTIFLKILRYFQYMAACWYVNGAWM